MRCHTIYRLLMTGHILKLDPPEFQTTTHTVYYTNQEEVDLKPYTGFAVGPHTATEWQIWTGPNGTGTLLYDTQKDSTDLQDLEINFPYSYPMTVYMRARQWSNNIESDWSSDLLLNYEYCEPYAPATGYVSYRVTHPSWGDSTSFMNNHAVWVENNGATNDILVGDIMSLYVSLTLNGSGTYLLQYGADDDCQVLAYNTTLSKLIVDWGNLSTDGTKGTPGLHAGGWTTPTTTLFSLPNGTYTFVFNLYNDPAPGNTWSANPGGSSFVISDNATGTVITDSANWPSSGAATAVFCDGGSLGTDGKCHCVVNTISTPTVTVSTDPIVTGSGFNLLGSPYSNQKYTAHSGSIWYGTFSPASSSLQYIDSSTPAIANSGSQVSDTGSSGTSPSYTISSSSASAAQGSSDRLFLKSSVQYTGANGVKSDVSDSVYTSIEYCSPTAAIQGSQAYKVDYTTSSSAQTAWNQNMKDHAIWIYYQGTNQTLMGQNISIQVSMSFPAGIYYVVANADDTGSITFDGVKIVDNLGFQDSATQTSTFKVNNTSVGTDIHTVILNAANGYEPDNTTWSGNPAGIAAVFYSVDSSGNKTLFTSTDLWPSETGVTINSYYCPGSTELNPSTRTCHCYKSGDSAS